MSNPEPRMMTHEYLLPLPAVDEWGTPTTKNAQLPSLR